MTSSYANDLRLNEMATGDASGSWGTNTNTNLELIGEALGFGTEAITTNADTHTSTIADGASDPIRAIFIKYTGTLDSACTITIGPNTVNKFCFIHNATSGSQSIIISQGSGANVTIATGQTKGVYLDGGSGGAAVVDAFATLSVVDLNVSGNLDVDGTANLDAVDIDGAVQIDNTVSVGVNDTGYDVKFFGDTASAFMLWDASADDLILGGAAGLSVNSAALVTGVLTTTAATVSNGGGQFNGAINVGVDDTGYDVKFFGATASAYMQWDASTDDLILGGVSRLGIGTTAPLSALHVQGADAASSVITVANGATTVSNGDSLGLYNFFGRDSSSNSVGGMGNISVTAVGDQNDGSTPTKMVFSTHPNSANDASLLGNVVARLTIDHEGALNQTSIAGGHTVFNTGGVDSDYTFKSNGNDNMLMIDGGLNIVGLGAAPIAQFAHAILQVGNQATLGANASMSTTGQTYLTHNLHFNPDGNYRVFNTSGANEGTIYQQFDGIHVWSSSAATTGNPTVVERFRVNANGDFHWRKNAVAFGTGGVSFINSNSSAQFTRDQGAPIHINRTGNTGSCIDLFQAGNPAGIFGTNSNDPFIARPNGNGLRFFNTGMVPCNSAGANADNSVSLGLSGARFDDAFITNGVTTGSDRTDKQDIAALTSTEMLVAARISKTFHTYRWKDAVVDKGDDARIHTGTIAQEVQAAFTAEGLDAGNYAMFMSDTWWEHDVDVAAVEASDAVDAVYREVTNSDGLAANEVVTEFKQAIEAADAYTRTDSYYTEDAAPTGSTSKTRLGIRYPELLSFLAAYNEQRFASIETRLTALEG